MLSMGEWTMRLFYAFALVALMAMPGCDHPIMGIFNPERLNEGNDRIHILTRDRRF